MKNNYGLEMFIFKACKEMVAHYIKIAKVAKTE